MIKLSDGFFMNVDLRNYTIGIPKKQTITNNKTGESKDSVIMTEARYYSTLSSALEGWWEMVRAKQLSEFDGSLEEAIELVKKQDEKIKTMAANFDIKLEIEEPMEETDGSNTGTKPEPRRRGRPRKVQ